MKNAIRTLWRDMKVFIVMLIMCVSLIVGSMLDHNRVFESDPHVGEHWVSYQEPEFHDEERLVTRVKVDAISLDGDKVRYRYEMIDNETSHAPDMTFETNKKWFKQIYDKE
ncbi:hypothetical protein VPHK567_0259 [Vibrio phage K567]